MPTLVLIWIWLCAYLNCAGWTLSALHQLNSGGYAVALALGSLAVLVWGRTTSDPFLPKLRWTKFHSRFRRPFSFAFLVLAALAFLGGVLYAPNNYDALAYRLPRVLHWLAAEQWHWIHTILPRINNRSCGIEWVSAPVVVLLKTDRPLFLINVVSFLLLPGLVFSVLTRLGVRPRVAWHWMWLAPTGYCFVLQAGSIGNDLFGAAFALAAVDFALRARSSGSARDFFGAILAAAMMTSAKTASLPLLLPCALALAPSLKLILRWPLRTALVCVIGILASALPTMVLNVKYSAGWSGADLSRSGTSGAVFLRIGANVVSFVAQNLAPPVFPLASKWNAAVIQHLPEGLESRLRAVMVEPQAYDLSLPEMQMEENAGLGFGVSALLLASVAAAGFARQKKTFPPDSLWLLCVRWSPVVSLLALMTQYNLSFFCRILTPYYLLLLPVFLAGAGHAHLVKNRLWRQAVFAVFAVAAGLLIISPARPLFPAQLLLSQFSATAPSKWRARIVEVYSVYRDRNDGLAPARAILPPDLKVLGMITFDDPEASLWRPFGSRRIEHVCPEDSATTLKARGIEYILLREETPKEWFACSFEDWRRRVNAQVVKQLSLNLLAARGPRDWYLVKLN